MRDPNDRLQDILDAISLIERYTASGRDAFDEDELVRIWVLHHLQIIGEAARHLGPDFHTSHPEIPWAHIVAMRNVLVHDYFGVDVEQLWAVVEHDLPPLRAAVQALLRMPGNRGGQ